MTSLQGRVTNWKLRIRYTDKNKHVMKLWHKKKKKQKIIIKRKNYQITEICINYTRIKINFCLFESVASVHN